MVIQRSSGSPPPPQGSGPRPTDLKVDGPVDTVALGHALSDRLSQQFAQTLSVGESMSFTTPDGHKLVVNGQGGPRVENWVGNLKEFLTAGAQEVGMAVQAGPNLALTGITEMVKPLVMNGVPDDAVNYVGQWYTPAVRAVSIGISLKQFWDRFHQNQAKMAEGHKLSMWDKVGAVGDGLHVLTSAAGVLGAIGGALVPAWRGIGQIGVGIAVAGDVGNFAVNGLEYLDKRGHVQILPVPEPDPQPQPPPMPPTPPTPPTPPGS